MHFNRLGESGLKVSGVCLGCMTFGDPAWKPWALGEDDSKRVIRAAVDHGINFFDTADIYSNGRSEEIVGAAVKECMAREDAVISTKVFLPHGSGPNRSGLSRKHMLHAVDKSLERLQTDYIDLYVLHRWDYDTPLHETLSSLADIIRAGKVRYVGLSSVFAWQLLEAKTLAEQSYGFTFISMQNHYNLLYREEEREMLPLCAAKGVGVTPYSPLARGFLTRLPDAGSSLRSKTDDQTAGIYDTPENRQVVTRVHETARKLDVKPSDVALAWLKSRPAVSSVIVGASKSEQLADAVSAVALELPADDVAYIEEPYRTRPVIGHY